MKNQNPYPWIWALMLHHGATRNSVMSLTVLKAITYQVWLSTEFSTEHWWSIKALIQSYFICGDSDLLFFLSHSNEKHISLLHLPIHTLGSAVILTVYNDNSCTL